MKLEVFRKSTKNWGKLKQAPYLNDDFSKIQYMFREAKVAWGFAKKT